MNFKSQSEKFTEKKKTCFNIKSAIVGQLFLIVLLFLAVFFISPNLNLSETQELFYLSWLGTITFIISVLNYYLATNSLLSPYIMFYLSFFLFQYGQLLLYALSIKFDYIHLSFYASLWDNDSVILLDGTRLIIFCIALFNLGALFSLIGKREKLNKQIDSDFLSFINRKNKIAGWIIFFITIIPTIYVRGYEALISVKYGYSGVYLRSEAIPIISSLEILFVPSCILLLVSYKNKKNVQTFIQTIMVILSGMYLIGGGRTEGIAILLVLVIYNTIQKEKINFKKLVVTGIILFLIATLTSTISEYRGITNKSFNNFILVLLETISENNPIVKTIGEMGWSMGTVFMTMEIMQNTTDFKYGESYVASFARIFPSSLDFTGIITGLHVKASKISSLISDYYNFDFGTDTTLIAESYYNFGNFGVIAILIIGFIIGKILAYKSKAYLLNNSLALYIKLAGLYSLFTLPRRSFAFLIGQILYVLILVPLFVILVRKIKLK